MTFNMMHTYAPNNTGTACPKDRQTTSLCMHKWSRRSLARTATTELEAQKLYLLSRTCSAARVIMAVPRMLVDTISSQYSTRPSNRLDWPRDKPAQTTRNKGHRAQSYWVSSLSAHCWAATMRHAHVPTYSLKTPSVHNNQPLLGFAARTNEAAHSLQSRRYAKTL